jgi:LysR family glycine cleavage system transcriptional activator
MVRALGSRENWESLRVFAACAQLGTFTRAARQLGLTQAAVSQRIRQLEVRLGTPLFQRSPQLALTAEGERLMPHILNAFSSLERGLAEVRRERSLVITTTLAMASIWLVPRLWRFNEANPDLTVSLDVTDDLRYSGDARFDVAIRTGDGSWEGMESEELFPVMLTPMIAPRLVRGQAPPPTNLLATVPLLPDAAWARWFHAAHIRRSQGFRYKRIRVTSQVLAAEIASAGECVALLSPHFMASYVHSGRLVAPWKTTVQGGQYFVAWPIARADSSAVIAFRNWLRSEIDSDITG